MTTRARSELANMARIVVPIAALLIGRASLADDAHLPPAQSANGISYVTGGDDYAAAKTFEKSFNQYPLSIELFEKAGPNSQKYNHVKDEYTANADVKIMDASGKVVFDRHAQGPFMMIDLAPGKYWITAELGKTMLKKTDVMVTKGGHDRATFVFPEGTA